MGWKLKLNRPNQVVNLSPRRRCSLSSAGKSVRWFDLLRWPVLALPDCNRPYKQLVSCGAQREVLPASSSYLDISMSNAELISP